MILGQRDYDETLYDSWLIGPRLDQLNRVEIWRDISC